MIRVVQGSFPGLNRKLDHLPDPRRQEFCRYTSSHLWWHVIGTFLSRVGSRNAFDETRLTGEAPYNMGVLCGQEANDPRFDGRPTITCSDNAAYHASRVDPLAVTAVPVGMVRELLERRMFDSARLFGRWYVVIVDGTVQEKCRAGFEADGKTTGNGARYRYVLRAQLLGPQGRTFPLMHEFMDMHDPIADKEDCELKAFKRMSAVLKREFPRLPICIVGDALYACEPVIRICSQYQWKYVLTLKEGRQPTTWDELVRLLPLNRANRLRHYPTPSKDLTLQDFRWVANLILGDLQTHVILLGEAGLKTACLYAYAVNFPNLTPERVLSIILDAGRKRPLIEDAFNAEKNHGIGLEHVFCADPNAAKNYFTMMMVAQIIWNLLCYGCLKRLYQWARDATAQGLARAIWNAFQAFRLPANLPPIGQIRFCTD